MNVNALRKNYDKLTIKERFSAISAAISRKDDNEIRVLNETAPRKTFAISHHYFYRDAVLVLAMMYQCQQLSNAGALMLIPHFDDERGEGMMDVFGEIAAHMRRDAVAWRSFCNEIGVDPAALLDGLPGDAMIEYSSRLAEIVADEPDPLAVGEVVQLWRKFIADLAGPVE